MSRDQRVQDNHALLLAQKEAVDRQLPLVVVFNLINRAGVRSSEHYEFMMQGIKQIERDLEELCISFVIKIGDPVENIISLAEQTEAVSLYFDFNPLLGVRANQKKIAAQKSALFARSLIRTT